MKHLPGILTRSIGVASVVLALAGFWYSFSVYGAMRSVPVNPDTPYFKTAYFSMLGICLFFYSGRLHR